MRHTSFRRRSGLRIVRDMSRTDGRVVSVAMVPLLGPDDPDGVACGCGVTVRRLSNGRPMAHGPGGQRPSARLGIYKCEGSGYS